MKHKDTHKEAVIDIRNLSIAFDDHQVLDNLSLALHPEENLVVLGKSGTGKSVLIKCIVRLLRPDKGEIRIFGDDVMEATTRELAEIRKKVGFLFQSGALYDSMTVRENLEFPLRRIRKDLKEKDIREKVSAALENVGLPDAIDKMPSQLSGGQRKRIGLARTIIVEPDIILYDEPTTGLDPITSNEISHLINDIQKKFRTSSIIITHDIECARTVGDRFVMMNDGKVIRDGSLADFENSDDEFVRSFFNTQNATP